METENGMATIFDKDKIVDEIIKANGAKRLQANNTPFRTEPLRTEVGERGDFERWEKILDKTFSIPDIDESEEGTKHFIKYLQGMKKRERSIEWTQQEYISSWKKMKEDKSSYPGITTAHMKCIHQDSLAARVASTLALVPFKTGYCPKNWKLGIDSMIPKKDMKEYRPKKLRLILLMDVRFNHANKLVGKMIMEQGEHYGLLSNEQFGSRKAKSALEHALNKRLILDLARQKKCNAIYLTNDAKSCYDRILLMVAYMTMRRFGIPINVAKCVITGLIEMVCRIRTAHGDSKKSYSAQQLRDFMHGVGQGNGYGPAIWAAISSILFKILQDLGFGTDIYAPISRELLQLVAISFVDDTDSITLGRPNETWNELITRAQKGLDMWECLIRTTGGAIEPGKSFWVGISPNVDDKGRTILEESPQGQMWITSLNGGRENLVQKDIKEANLGLGVWQAPNGQEDTQTKMMLEKIKEWNSNVKTYVTNKFEGRSMINLTIGKKIRYPLAATALSQEQCDKVTKSLTWTALGKAGIVRTASQVIVNSPTTYGGFGIRTNVYEMQFIDHLKMILRHGHRQTVTGKLIRVSAETTSIEAGVIGDPFELNNYELDLLTDKTWIHSTIQMINHNGVQLTSDTRQLNTWANEDETLIDNIQEFRDICGKIFNKVRLHLKVVTLSDVCTADFSYIDNNMFEAINDYCTVSPSVWSYEWPIIRTITEKDKKIWKQGLKLIFNTDDTRKLNQTCMRDWDGKYLTWFAWVIHGENTIYNKIGQYEWRVWSKVTTSGRYRFRLQKTFVKTLETVDRISEECLPVTIKMIDETTIKLECIGNTRAQYDVDNCTHWTTPRFNTNKRDMDGVVAKIKNDDCKITVGESDDDRSLAKFTINGTEIVAVTKIPGSSTQYRQVLGGILTAVRYVQKLAENYNITYGSCIIGSTCLGALKASFGAKEPTAAWKQIDILDMIRSQVTTSTIKWRIMYITREKEDYCEWNKALKTIHNDVTPADDKCAEECQELIKGEKWRIDIDYQSLDRLEESLRSHIYEERMKSKYKRYFKLNDDDLKDVSWEVFKLVNNKNPTWKHLFMTKFSTRIMAVMKNLKRRKHSETDSCPNCGQLETTEHILVCKATVMEEAWVNQMEEFKEFLNETTSVNIRCGIMTLLRYLRSSERINFEESFPNDLSFLVKRQASLGPSATFGGIWLQEWIKQQKSYHERFNIRLSAKTWLLKMICKLQDILISLWVTRNKNLHHNEESDYSQKEHERLNNEIEEIYKRIPHPRLLSMDGRRFFHYKKEYLLKKRRRAKDKWIKEANMIINRFEKEQTGQSKRFISYFAPD